MGSFPKYINMDGYLMLIYQLKYKETMEVMVHTLLITSSLGSILLTWINFNLNMDK